MPRIRGERGIRLGIVRSTPNKGQTHSSEQQKTKESMLQAEEPQRAAGFKQRLERSYFRVSTHQQL